MGYKFTLVLNREITDDESESLQKAGCADATITTTAHPTDADSLATQLDIDTEAISLEEAIQSALDAVDTVPDLSVPVLDVPPQPNGISTEDEAVPAAIPASTEAALAENAAAPADEAAPAENGAASGAS